MTEQCNAGCKCDFLHTDNTVKYLASSASLSVTTSSAAMAVTVFNGVGD